MSEKMHTCDVCGDYTKCKNKDVGSGIYHVCNECETG